jgi:hypothetical protein
MSRSRFGRNAARARNGVVHEGEERLWGKSQVLPRPLVDCRRKLNFLLLLPPHQFLLVVLQIHPSISIIILGHIVVVTFLSHQCGSYTSQSTQCRTVICLFCHALTNTPLVCVIVIIPNKFVGFSIITIHFEVKSTLSTLSKASLAISQCLSPFHCFFKYRHIVQKACCSCCLRHLFNLTFFHFFSVGQKVLIKMLRG